jgi:tight adherence protein B
MREVRERRASPAAAPAGFVEVEAAAIFRPHELSTIRLWGALLERISHVDRLRVQIAEADLKWTTGRVTALMLFLGAVTLAALIRIAWIPPVLLVLAPLMAASSPYLYILQRRRKRFHSFAGLFPEALDSLSRALRAGYPLAAAFEAAASEYPEPLSGELRRARDEWNLGVGWDQALDNLSRRIPIAEVRLFVAAVKLQNRMGGRLNDVLARLSETMRDSVALDSEVRSISAHSRLTGLVLTIMPLAIAVFMLAVNPAYIAVLFESPEGRAVVSLAIAANVAAHLLIRKIARIRF